MPNLKSLAACGVSLSLLLTVAAPAQQPPQQGARGPQQSQMSLQQAVPVEGIMGFLVFEEDLTDQQLIDTRDVLMGIYDQRGIMSSKLQSGETDPNTLGPKVTDLRTEMVDNLSEVLDDEQDQHLREVLGMAEPAPAPSPQE